MTDKPEPAEVRMQLKPSTHGTLSTLSELFGVPVEVIAAAWQDHLTMSTGHRLAAQLRQDRDHQAAQAIAAKRAKDRARKAAARKAKPPGSEKT